MRTRHQGIKYSSQESFLQVRVTFFFLFFVGGSGFLRNVILFPRGIMCSKMKMPLYRGHRARQRSNKCIYFIPPFQRHSKQMYKSLETINNLLSGGNSSKANQNLLFIWFLKLSKQKSITPCERAVPYPFFNSETALSDSETQKRCLYMLCSQK